MTKLATLAWLTTAMIVCSGCADTSETAGGSQTQPAAAADPAAGAPTGTAKAVTAAAAHGGHAGAADTSTAANVPGASDGTQPATGGRPAGSAIETGGGRKPKPAMVKARLASKTTPAAQAGAAGVNPTGAGGSASPGSVAAVPPEAALTAKTGVAEFTAILLDRIRRKINQKRGRPNPPPGNRFRGTPAPEGLLQRSSR